LGHYAVDADCTREKLELLFEQAQQVVMQITSSCTDTLEQLQKKICMVDLDLFVMLQ
jgi:hypothetical protein